MLKTSKVTHLSMNGGSQRQLKEQLIYFLQGLCGQCNLEYLDISGHQIGPDGTFWIGELLRVNISLKTLYWDDNGTTFASLKHFRLSLMQNFSLNFSPLPYTDIVQIQKSYSNQTEINNELLLIQKCLQRNHELFVSTKKRTDLIQDISKLKDYDEILQQIVVNKDLALTFREFLHKNLSGEVIHLFFLKRLEEK